MSASLALLSDMCVARGASSQGHACNWHRVEHAEIGIASGTAIANMSAVHFLKMRLHQVYIRSMDEMVQAFALSHAVGQICVEYRIAALPRVRSFGGCRAGTKQANNFEEACLHESS